MFYEKFPKFIESENCFFVGEKKINRNKTLEQNNINNYDIITLKMNEVE